MLAAVDLNDQPTFMTDKIDNELSDRRLTTEAQSGQPICA